MPKLIIDNLEVEVPEGTKVIEAAERLGIMIPRFCYHPALGAVGACRVCAVAFKEGPVKGIQMSCMVDAQDQMVVSTTDAEAVDFRRHVIEWLMLNHPHDCPVCDEGGHCLLQDLTVSGGHGLRRYPGRKRTHVDQYLGPLVQHEMNRCIQCYRCVRYYREYAGYRDLGVMGTASRVYFGRSAPGSLESPFCGNLIDICPTGVYTDKPSRFSGRRWDFERASSICLHCSLGCNLVTSARYRQVLRHEARANRAVNGHFICDRGRYGYAYASAAGRPRQALVKAAPRQADDALKPAGEKLLQTVDRYGPGCVAVIASMRSSVETLAVLTQACRQNRWMGPAPCLTARSAENLQTAVRRLKPALAVSMAEVSAADTVVGVGADPINEAPMLALSLRQVHRRGGHVSVIDPRGVRMPLAFEHRAVHPSDMKGVLEQLIEAVGEAGAPKAAGGALPADETDRLQVLAGRLMRSRRAVIVCGTDIVGAPEIALAADLVEALRGAGIDAGLFYTLAGANAFSAGLPASADRSVDRIIDRIESARIRALVVVENDLWRQFPQRDRLLAALDRLEAFILLDHVASPLNTRAHFFIPTQTIYEAGGHWINQEGRLQSARAVFGGGEPIEISGNGDHPPRVFDSRTPGAQPQAAWRALAKLASAMGENIAPDPERYLAEAVQGFHPAVGALTPADSGQRIELGANSAGRAVSPKGSAPPQQDLPADALTLLMVDWTFGTEPLSAQSAALAQVARSPAASMHPGDIQRLRLEKSEAVTISTGTGRFSVPLAADSRMAPGVVVIPRHCLLEWQIFDDTRVAIKPEQIRPAASRHRD